MRFRQFAILAGVILLCGCAKFPSGQSGAGYTRLTFGFTTNGPINPNYIYVVAIRVLTPPVGSDTTLSDPTQGPVPVVTTGSKNGIVEGLPTQYVIFTPTDPNLWQVYRFPTRASEGTSADPTDPSAMDLRWPGTLVGDVLAGSGINPVNPDGSYGTQMGFSIDTSYLVEPNGSNDTMASQIQIIQFNILTMNVAATTSGNVSERVLDAIGNQSSLSNPTFSNPIQVNILSGNTYTDQSSTVPEQANDTFGGTLPPVDLTSWSLTVTPP